jgi:antitoxin HicB
MGLPRRHRKPRKLYWILHEGGKKILNATNQKTNPRAGSDFDDFLREENLYDEVTAGAIMRKAVRDVRRLMEENHVTVAQLAARMATSRSQVQRIFEVSPHHTPTVKTLVRVADALGVGIQINFMPLKGQATLGYATVLDTGKTVSRANPRGSIKESPAAK